MPDRPGSSREGREPLIDAAANLFASATLKEAAGFVGPRAVAESAGKSLGTVTHHFPAGKGKNLRAEAVRRALSRTGEAESGLSLDLANARAKFGVDGDTALDEVAAALARELGVFSPDEGPNDPIIEAEETAAFLGAAVAPRDEVAAGLLRDFTAPHIAIHTEVSRYLVEALGLRWADGMSAEAFGLTTNSLASGFRWTRRFDRAAAPLKLYADMYIRMFSASTVPAISEAIDDYRVSLLSAGAVPRGSSLDQGKRAAVVAAAHRIYDRRRRWEDITVTAVAKEANVSRPTVISNFQDRNGLAAAVWARHLPSLTHELDGSSRLPLLQALHQYLTALVTAARTDKYLTGAFLDGVFRYTVHHGAPNPADPADPRTLVPLPPMLAPLIQDNANHFRAGNAGNPREALDSAALLTNHTLHLAITRPQLESRKVVNRICETTLAGMLLRRPKPP